VAPPGSTIRPGSGSGRESDGIDPYATEFVQPVEEKVEERGNVDLNVTMGEEGSRVEFPIGITDYDYIRYSCRSYNTEFTNNRIDEQFILYLPMPAELSEQLEAGWTAQDDWLKRNATFLGASARLAIVNEFNTGGTKLGLVEAVTGATLKAFGGDGIIQKNIERSTGRVVNPVSEQFFTGMSHRTWEFMHKLVAESPADAKRIDEIINRIKSSSSASMTENDPYFLNYPLIWNVQFMMGIETGAGLGSDKPNHFLPKLNPCAVTQVATNFSGAGAWARHEDGAPVEIDLTVSLTELVIPTAANFGGKKDPDGKKLGVERTYGWEQRKW
jgi:hypothetical protein